ncbi:MAG: GH32 C-terminal domain-containing protein [bacterium]
MNPFPLPSGQFSGDTFPVFRDGVCHLFHMMPPVIAHHVSRDMVNWEERPVVVARGVSGEPDCNNNATGCVVEHEGRFYMFYTGNQNICLTISNDLDNWTKYPLNPVLAGDNKQYSTENFRDAFVFYYEPEKCWWMLFGTRTMAHPGQRAGCVGLAKSQDVLHWELHPPLWSPEIGPHCDCPQLINHQEKWYLFYLQRNTRVRVADSPEGPFLRAVIRNLFTPLCSAGSRPAWDGKRWITFPFIMRLVNESEDGDWQYGGPLAIPRQLQFLPDGSVAEKAIDEMISTIQKLPNPGNPVADAEPLVGRWNLQERQVACLSDSGGTLLFPSVTADCYLDFDLILNHKSSDFHLLLRTGAELLNGYQLSLHPTTSQISLRQISEYDIDRVMVNRHFDLPIGSPIHLRAFLKGDILEVFINEHVSLTARLYSYKDGQAGIEFRDGSGIVKNIQWRELK